jgi:hypothetical protein
MLIRDSSNSTYIRINVVPKKIPIVAQIKPARLVLASELSAVPVVVQSPVSEPASGSCAEWLAEAGITVTHGVMELINGESGCNPYAQNASGACGIGQDINGCSTYDPVAQLQWMNNYVLSRYGSWANAYDTWLSRSPHWY